MNTTTTGLLGLVTTEEAARLLGVTASAIRQRVHRNRIYSIYVGRALLVSLADLKASYETPPRVATYEEVSA